MEIRPLNNLVVVGGGTAGWLTAIYAKQVFPKASVTLIESEQVPILGAGEGTTPPFTDLFDSLNIPLSELVKEAGATVKFSIQFSDWKFIGSKLHHSFHIEGNLGLRSCNVFSPRKSDTNLGLLYTYVNDLPLKDFNIYYDLAETNKVPFVLKPTINKESNPIFNYFYHSAFATHFNAVKLANYLKKVAIERGVYLVKGTVDYVKKDDYGDIKTLVLEDKKEINVDFLFDCSGFARLFIGKEYKSEWVSHSKYLITDSAIPSFPKRTGEDIPIYTESTGMKFGWSWKVPADDRYGAGYVFSSKFIDENDARKEFLNRFKYDESDLVDRVFKFEPGYYKTQWVKNCVAIGLAAGFVEPLEATSLLLVGKTFFQVFSNPLNMALKDEHVTKTVNRRLEDLNKEVVELLYFHFMYGRKDTEFWKHFTFDNAPDGLKEKLELWQRKVPEVKDFPETAMFGIDSWMQLAIEKEAINKEVARKYYDLLDIDDTISNIWHTTYQAKKAIQREFVTHTELLKGLKS